MPIYGPLAAFGASPGVFLARRLSGRRITPWRIRQEQPMKKHLMPEMKEGGVNVTPLIDIVMVLIIFFMLVAKIGVTTGADATIDPPETILGVSLKDLGNTLTLNVRGGPRLEEPIVTALVERG